MTIDAMGCQREIAERIRDGGGDYALAVRQNKPKLYEQVEGAISEALDGDTVDFDPCTVYDFGSVGIRCNWPPFAPAAAACVCAGF